MFDAYNFAAESNFLSNSFNNFANARRIITDYKVTADGNTYSGKALDNGLDKYYNQVNKIDEEDLRNNGLPPMELEDGTVIPGDTMRKIISQMNGEDAGVDIDYGPLGIGNPNPTNPENGFPNGPSGFVPWFVDMALSSAPYFTTPTAIPMAVGNMGTAVQGIKPGANINDGTYRLMSEDPTFDEIATPAMASLLMPLTERIWGPVGSRMIGEKGGGPISSGAGKVFERVLGKGPRAELAKTNVPLRLLTGALDEGLEEIPGNIMEELQNSGLANWYMTDNMGENRGDRWGNFWQDAPSSFFGGSVLGGAFGLGRTSEYQGDRAKTLNMLGNRINDLNEHGSGMNPGITMDGDILRAIASNLGDYSDEARSEMEQRISEARPQDLATARDRFSRDYAPGRNAQMRAIVDDAVSSIPGVMRNSVDSTLRGMSERRSDDELWDDYANEMWGNLEEYRYGDSDEGWHRDYDDRLKRSTAESSPYASYEPGYFDRAPEFRNSYGYGMRPFDLYWRRFNQIPPYHGPTDETGVGTYDVPYNWDYLTNLFGDDLGYYDSFDRSSGEWNRVPAIPGRPRDNVMSELYGKPPASSTPRYYGDRQRDLFPWEQYASIRPDESGEWNPWGTSDDAAPNIPDMMRSRVDDVLSGIRQGNYLQELRDLEDDYRADMMRELDEYRYGGTDYGWHRDRVNDWWNPGYGSENYAYGLTPDDVTRRFARGSSRDYLDSLIRQYGEGIFDGNPIGPVLRGVYDTGLAEWDIPNEYPWQRIHRRRIEEQHEKAKENERRRERDKFYGPADGLWFDENWLPF